MAQEQVYQPQVAPGGTAGIPLASPQDFGAGVGQGVAELGGALHERAITAYQIERRLKADQEATDVAARFARLRAQNDVAIEQRRNDPNVGPAGMTADISKMLEGQQQDLLGGITETSVRQSVQRQWDEYQASTIGAVDLHEQGALIKKSGDDVQTAMGISRNRIASADPGSDVGKQETDAVIGGIHASNLPFDVKEKVAREALGQMDLGHIESMVNHGQANVALATIDAGAFDAHLTPEQREWARRHAETQVHVEAAAARAEQAHALTATREQLATVKVGLDTGAGTPQDWTELGNRYEAIGDTSSAVSARAKGAEQMASLAYRGEQPTAMQARIADLQGKQANGGLSVAQASELNGLKDLYSQSMTRLAGPGGALAQYEFATGKPVPPLNPADPASMRARAQIATAAAQTYGRATVEPLRADEIAGLKDLASGTAAQKLQAIDMLRGFGDTRAIAGAARQIAGNDDAPFRIAALLQRDVARDVLIGGDTLKAHPQVWKQQQAEQDFAKWYGPALSWIGGEYRNDIFEAAKRFYAQRASDGGEHQYNPGRFAEAIETVLGRTQVGSAVAGGVVHTPRGIIIAPAGMNGDAMLRTLARATPTDYLAASGGRHPRFSDGSPMDEAAFKALQPTAVANGLYGFRDAHNKLVHDDKGQTYAVDISKLPHP